MLTNYKKSWKILFSFSLLLFLMSSQIFAQGSVKGTVTDVKGNPLLGVNVILMDTQMGAATDFDGNYSISKVPAGDYTIKFSSIGYKMFLATVSVEDDKTVESNASLAEDILDFDQVVVTGVANPVSKLESSISISTLDMQDIQKSAPRTTAEMFRTIPGVRSESSGGDGNANITVRGVPMTDGGSKYLQLQEDGLPVLQFGDIAFATQDIFLRGDNTIARIEAIRGGSASTMATNSPAGIINFISKIGAVEGGSISTTQGLDYQSSRVDFEYGSPINENLSFHIGGFFREGKGVRTAGYNANSGGQIKMNITKKFEGGYGRIYFKHLDDRAAAYMPIPLKVEGTNADPTWSSIDGFDANYGTMHSPNLMQNLGFGPDGGLRTSNISDGMHPVSTAFGIEFVSELGQGWTLENRGRMAFNSGRFIAPFVAGLGSISDIAQSVSIDGIEGSQLKYTDGTAVGNGHEGNGLAMRIHLFDTELNNFDNLVNDFKVTKSFIDKIHLTLGYYVSRQNIDMSWLWNSYLMEVNGEDARLLDVYSADNTKLSENGLIAYGVPAWGSLHRNYTTNYFTNAPYANIEVEVNKNLRVDGSIRMDLGHVTGLFAGTVTREADVNNDGTISLVEKSVPAIDNANPTAVDYEYDYVSYSFGGNYKLNENQAVFARYSHGGVTKADRILFNGNYTYTGDSDDNASNNAIDLISQAELGYKHNFQNAALFITGFLANTSEKAGFEATTQRLLENDYQAFGVEIEGVYKINNLSINGGVTYTKAEVTTEGDLKGNKPKRHSDIMFNIIPSYSVGKHTIGLSMIGQSEAYADFNNELVMPAFAALNIFAIIQITDKFYASLNGNNILNSIGLTEVSGASITEGQVNYLAARPIPGRSVSLNIGYDF